MAAISPQRAGAPLQEELKALGEVLEIARQNLKTLLTCDHPPPGADILLLAQFLADLEWLVWDARSKIAMREFAKMLLE